jgi:Ca2+-binding RTX toxin-like protein
MNQTTTTRARVRRRLAATVGVAALLTAIGGIAAAPANAAVQCYGRVATVVGTAGADTIAADDGVTEGPDVIHGLGGNDLIFGLGGDDIICGGEGHDAVLGDAGNDKLAGNVGNDALYGGTQSDQLEGFDGDDILRGGDGNDRVDGGDGNAAYFHLDWGDDIVRGEGGNDLVRGAAGADRLDGGNAALNDGNNGTDVLHGYGGADTLRDISGNADYLWGGDGNDHLYSRDVPAFPTGDTVYGANGTDTCSADTNDSRYLCEIG